MVYSIPEVRPEQIPSGALRRTVAQGLAALPGPSGERSVAVLEHGTMQLKIYAPRGADPQQPHPRDELYIVARGSGEFVSEGQHITCATDDALFVAAGRPHRFENFSDDFVVWVVFYGPEGGERYVAQGRRVQRGYFRSLSVGQGSSALTAGPVPLLRSNRSLIA